MPRPFNLLTTCVRLLFLLSVVLFLPLFVFLMISLMSSVAQLFCVSSFGSAQSMAYLIRPLSLLSGNIASCCHLASLLLFYNVFRRWSLLTTSEHIVEEQQWCQMQLAPSLLSRCTVSIWIMVCSDITNKKNAVCVLHYVHSHRMGGVLCSML